MVLFFITPKGSTKITAVRNKNTKTKTIKSAHNTGHFRLGEQITVYTITCTSPYKIKS